MTTIDEIEAREVEVTHAEHDLNAATFAVRAASAALERARVRVTPSLDGNRGRTVSIAAPADGVVLRRLRQSEGLVSAGEPLLEIGDVRQLEIVTALLSNDAVRLLPGAAASVAQWGGDAVLPATVRRIEPEAFSSVSSLGLEEQRVNVILDFMETGEDYAPFGDAYRVDTRIVVWAAADVLKVPTSALIRHDGRWAVYVASAGRARRTLVTLGAHTGREAEVTAGLSAGTMVVVHPSDLMHDGVRIIDRTTR